MIASVCCSATLGHWILDSDQATDMPQPKLAAEVILCPFPTSAEDLLLLVRRAKAASPDAFSK